MSVYHTLALLNTPKTTNNSTTGSHIPNFYFMGLFGFHALLLLSLSYFGCFVSIAFSNFTTGLKPINSLLAFLRR